MTAKMMLTIDVQNVTILVLPAMVNKIQIKKIFFKGYKENNCLTCDPYNNRILN